MLSKSFRVSQEDAVGLEKILKYDVRVDSYSAALYYAYKDAALNPPNWNVVKRLHFRNIPYKEMKFGSTLSFVVDEDDYNSVVSSLKEQLNIDKIRISLMTRLVILNARLRSGDSEDKTNNSKEDDKFLRIQSYVDLLGKNDEVSLRKLAKIDEIINGEEKY